MTTTKVMEMCRRLKPILGDRADTLWTAYLTKDYEGRINMSGGGFVGPFPGGSGYASSKAALMRLTDSLAQELERVGSSVLVFGMGPGLVRTKMTEYQVETPEGRKWIPFVKERFDQRQDRPPEDCAEATVELIRIARPDLNGRIFDVEMDFAQVAKRASEIKDRDLFVIRFRSWDK